MAPGGGKRTAGGDGDAQGSRTYSSGDSPPHAAAGASSGSKFEVPSKEELLEFITSLAEVPEEQRRERIEAFARGMLEGSGGQQCAASPVEKDGGVLGSSPGQEKDGDDEEDDEKGEEGKEENPELEEEGSECEPGRWDLRPAVDRMNRELARAKRLSVILARLGRSRNCSYHRRFWEVLDADKTQRPGGQVWAEKLADAISCSGQTDVKFVLDDGITLGGHRSDLSLASHVFDRMLSSGMAESKTGIVRLQEFSESAVRGMLEWIYLGRAGKNCGAADGRELWKMSEMYDVKGLKEWMLQKCICGKTLIAAYSFGLSGGECRDDLVGACLEFARAGIAGEEDIADQDIINNSQGMWVPFPSEEELRGANVIYSAGLGTVPEESLLGAGIENIQSLIEVSVSRVKHVRMTMASRAILDGFTLVERWWKVNGDRCTIEDLRPVIKLLDFESLSSKDFDQICVSVGQSSLSNLLDKDLQENIRRSIHLKRDHLAKSTNSSSTSLPPKTSSLGEPSDPLSDAHYPEFLLGGKVGLFNDLESLSGLAIHEHAKSVHDGNSTDFAEHHLAVCDEINGRVLIFHVASSFGVQSSKRVGIVRAHMEGEGTDGDTQTRQDNSVTKPCDVAFNSRGQLFVSFPCLHVIQVFDEKYEFVRSIGGELCFPLKFCFRPGGDLVVADRDRGQVLVLKQDGELVLAIEHNDPTAVAAGMDGSIYVGDLSCQIRVFDNKGCFVRKIATQEPPGYPGVASLAVGANNEVFVSMIWCKGIFEFDRNGVEVVGSTRNAILGEFIAEENKEQGQRPLGFFGGSHVPEIKGLAVDSRGRLFAGCDCDNGDAHHVKMLV